MIIIRVELKSARTGKTSEIGRMLIDNVSGGGIGRYDRRANYRVRLLRRNSEQVLRQGEVKNYPRLSYSIWRLVFRALKSVLWEENSNS
jgi:hypothetical protein